MRRPLLIAATVVAALGSVHVPAQGVGDAVRLEAEGIRMVGSGAALVITDAASGRELKRINVAAAGGADPSRVSAIRLARERRSFVVGFEALPEIWEISIDPKAPDLYQGMVHDFRLGEGVPERGYLGVRRTRLDAALPRFALDRTGAYVVGCRADSPPGGCTLALLHLDVRRRIAQFALKGVPDLGAVRDGVVAQHAALELPDAQGTISWRIDLIDHRLMATPPAAP
ncbi:MAG: hypothetical protein JNK75_09135 [Betaproteobacteria bacterium]|nr:hypothetical protein [Betaproteobacteria bacterium]